MRAETVSRCWFMDGPDFSRPANANRETNVTFDFDPVPLPSNL